jgi:hypothetical protein
MMPSPTLTGRAMVSELLYISSVTPRRFGVWQLSFARQASARWTQAEPDATMDADVIVARQ